MTRAETFISTHAIAHSLRDEYWREVTRPFCDTTLLATDKGATLEGTMRIRHLGGLTLGSTTFNAQRYKRDPATIARSGLDQYLVHVLVAGSIHGDFDDRDVTAGAGGICFIDLARPYQCRVDAGERLAMTIPRANIDKILGARDIHGLVLQAGNPMTRLLKDYLCGFHAVSGQLSASEDVAALEALTTLLSAGLANAAPIQNAPDSLLGQALRARVLAYIDHHLAQPELGPELLMQRFRVSRAHLYRVFAELGGIAHIIKCKRLDAAYARIVDPRHARHPVGQTAAHFGFRDPARFRKAFIARFGVAPDEAREQCRLALPAGDSRNLLASHFSAHSHGHRHGLQAA
ncbi:AraC-like DNA-binding protein [Achromobacter deleyi]|uniref:AraC-like ligand-binding domain-containing protein n=1 Tax=Achromobacter deleyi TaxID=1353891 RepID=UPI00286411A1|nr:helix-turn-helix domain-containing protein [Achromobacter deleyi]MDR6599300.1 AraC-like DNA-binding protein [Achromobacter deleyi]